MFELKKAERKNVKLRIGLFGPSGSDKTMSALRLTRGLVDNWTEVAVLDTENGSAELYSHLGAFMHSNFAPPFSPDNYMKGIKIIANSPGIKVLIIDSISQEWEGEGGCLEIHTNIMKGQRASNSYTAWANVTPLHQRFIQAISQCPCHIVATGRSKIEYVLQENAKGRQAPVKMGMKTVTRDGFDYEMTIAFQLNQQNYAEVDKDRTNIFHDFPPFIIPRCDIFPRCELIKSS